MVSPRSGCRGAMMVHRPGRLCAKARWASATTWSSPSCVLAAISSGRPPKAARSRSSAALSTSGAGASTFRLPTDIVAGAPERAEAVGEAFVLREHQCEATEQSLRQPRHAAPSAKRSFGHARVDQGERKCRARRSNDQVGPDLRLGKDRRIGLPMLEKAVHVSRQRRAGHTDGSCAGQRAGGRVRPTSRFRS